jgi:hypothetical protein
MDLIVVPSRPLINILSAPETAHFSIVSITRVESQ